MGPVSWFTCVPEFAGDVSKRELEKRLMTSLESIAEFHKKRLPWGSGANPFGAPRPAGALGLTAAGTTPSAFGMPAAAAPSPFAAAPAPAAGGGLFGAPAAAAAPAGGGLFGTPAAAAPSPFGAPAAAGGGLFGAPAAATTPRASQKKKTSSRR